MESCSRLEGAERNLVGNAGDCFRNGPSEVAVPHAVNTRMTWRTAMIMMVLTGWLAVGGALIDSIFLSEETFRPAFSFVFGMIHVFVVGYVLRGVD